MNELYDKIGLEYDSTRSCDRSILERIVPLLKTQTEAKILDIGCGTGNYTIGLKDSGFSMYGLDISETMLEKAKLKSSDINWINADVNNIPFDSNFFDGCVCVLACHHFKDLNKSFGEVYRVLNKGRFVLMTCTHEQIRNYWLYRYFPKELEKITTYMPDIDQLVKTLYAVGFRMVAIESFYITEDLEDNFLGARFEKPFLYLDENFRNGMSIFANKSNPESVSKGCEKLRKDIESGEYEKYIKNYNNQIGEYCFLIVEKI